MSQPVWIFPNLFTVFFVPAMLLMPLVTAACLLARRDTDAAPEALARSRTLMKLLAAATGLAFASWIGLSAAASLGPRNLHTATSQSWILFFPLWFGLAMPAVNARLHRPTPQDPPATPRVASLVSREHASPVKAWWWAVAIGLWAISLGVSVVLALSIWNTQPSHAVTGLSSNLFTLVLLAVILPVALRATLNEPEPLDARGSVELAGAYADLRRVKITFLFWLLAVPLPALTTATTAAIIAAPTLGPWIGVSGGAAGTLLGIAGAIVGLSMSRKHRAISEARRKLNEPHPNTEPQPRTPNPAAASPLQ